MVDARLFKNRKIKESSKSWKQRERRMRVSTGTDCFLYMILQMVTVIESSTRFE